MYRVKHVISLKYSVYLITTVCMLSSCGQNSPSLGTVYGVVKIDGQPLAKAQLFFIPSSGGRISMAETDLNGHYQLMYSAGKQGAVVGHHVVKITSAVSEVADLNGKVIESARKEMLPSRYHAESELTAQVRESKNEVNFDLNSK